MKIFKYSLIVLLFNFMAVQAQDFNFKKYSTKIDSTYNLFPSNNYMLSIFIDTTEFREYHVNVYSPNGKKIQLFSSINYEAKMEGDFLLQDINFDGYDDLLVKVNDDPFNYCFEFWVFDPIAGEYNYDSLSSDLISCNPSFDKNLKTISTARSDGYTWSFWRETYSYNNDKLILIEEESRERYGLIDSTHHKYSYRRIKRVRQGDEMVTVEDIIGTLEELMRE